MISLIHSSKFGHKCLSIEYIHSSITYDTDIACVTKRLLLNYNNNN